MSRRSVKKSIYGIDRTNRTDESGCACVAEPPPEIGLQLFASTLLFFKNAIEKFFPRIGINAPFTAAMRVSGVLPPAIVVRLIWGKRYPGVKFNPQSQIHLLQIKDIYLEVRADWNKDILFK
ncbi:hypothetical protein EBZ80_25315 [bacterium]|nr:hypothetical protein [bacterium]